MGRVSKQTPVVRLPAVIRLVDLALEEDLGRGDVTTDAIFEGRNTSAQARVVAREAQTLYGVAIAEAVFQRDKTTECTRLAWDGQGVSPGDVVMDVKGEVASILRAERVALNFLGRLSGIATLTRSYVDAVCDTAARVVDTRKTTPGYRVLEKLAVKAGGGANHRADLASGVLIKDNHIAACGSITEAVQRVREHAAHSLRIEVEIDRLEQLEEAIAAGAEILLLDNMGIENVREGVRVAHESGVLVEVSGGITLDTIASYAQTGADFISVGAITHSARTVDLALEVVC